MIGAIVGDYFGGAINALGVQIENSISLFDFPLGWAAIVVASAFGIAFYIVVIVAERSRCAGVPSTDEKSAQNRTSDEGGANETEVMLMADPRGGGRGDRPPQRVGGRRARS